MRKLDAVETVVTEVMVQEVVGMVHVSKSQRMKDLFDLGMRIKDIAEAMEVRYNFAYNVVTNYVNVSGIEVVKTQKAGKKDQIIELFLAGKTNTEISKELMTNYNYVYKVLKDYKGKLEAEAAEQAEAVDLKKKAAGAGAGADTKATAGDKKKETKTKVEITKEVK